MESPHREEPILTSQNIVGILRTFNLGCIHLIADCICAAAAASVVAGVVAETENHLYHVLRQKYVV